LIHLAACGRALFHDVSSWVAGAGPAHPADLIRSLSATQIA